MIHELSREERIAELWHRGRLRWKLRPHQREIYDAYRGQWSGRFFGVNADRQTGKTYTLGSISLEDAIQHPRWSMLYATFSLKATRGIVIPTVYEILADCPASLRPEFNSMEGELRFPNGATLLLAGLDEGRAEYLRGRKFHRIFVDEAGFIDNLEYIVQSVLFPTTMQTDGRMLISSSAPLEYDHPYWDLMDDARARKAFVLKTIFDDPTRTKEQIEAAISMHGGVETPGFRREHLGERIVDPSYAVIPEMVTAGDIVRAVTPAPHFFPMAAMDIGFKDLTVVLFGYWDFRAAKLVVQRELVLDSRVKRWTTADLAEGIRTTEATLWPKPQRAPLRWSDTDLIVINDLANLHQITFTPTAKDDKEAQVNAVRIAVKERKIQVDPSCETTIHHMRTAIWNKPRTEFARSGRGGHYDAVDALIYMWRNALRHENPYPEHPPGVTEATHFLPPAGRRPQDEAIMSMVRPRYRGR